MRLLHGFVSGDSAMIAWHLLSGWLRASSRWVGAGEAVVPASELADAMKQIRELQRMLGKKTMDA